MAEIDTSMLRVLSWITLSGVFFASAYRDVHQMAVERTMDSGLTKSFHVSEIKVLQNGEAQYGNCRPTDPLHITELHFPDPIKENESVQVSVTISVKENMTDPLHGKLKIQQQVGDQWVDVCPYIKTFFNCDLGDVYSLLQLIKCPKAVQEAKWNCTCPIQANTYSIQKLTQKLKSIPIQGVFNVSLDLGHNDTHMGCAWIKFEIV